MLRIIYTFDEVNLHNFDLKRYESFYEKFTELSDPKPKLPIKKCQLNHLISPQALVNYR